MAQPAITVSGLGKEYRLGTRERYLTLRDTITDLVKRPWTAAKAVLGGGRPVPPPCQTMWALRDVTFDVPRGQVIGVIGRNGAGKSTLLKILSRITVPSTGEAIVRGRIGSLLEVGTGFHPELTGRENIFMNGAILGMRKREIDAALDSIVAFAEVERFLDTPVKRYSSGMHVRLAFAVAAHLNCPNLLMDEVLAVGDHAFQSKCLNKMKEVSDSGRTILFVSHNLAAVRSICSRALWIKDGQLAADGDPSSVIQQYLQAAQGPSSSGDLVEHPGRWQGKVPVLRRVELLDQGGDPATMIATGGTLRIRLQIELPANVERVALWAGIHDAMGDRVVMLSSTFQPEGFEHPGPRFGAECVIPSLPLVPGRYTLTLWVEHGKAKLDLVEHAISFDLVESDYFGSGRLPEGPGRGRVLLPARWLVGPAGLAEGEPCAKGAMHAST